MDVDRKTGIIYISTYDTYWEYAQLRTLDPLTGHSNLIHSWGPHVVEAFTIAEKCQPIPLVENAFDPIPVSGTFNVPTSLEFLEWQNGSNATSINLSFGEIWDINSVYNGPNVPAFQPQEIFANKIYCWKIASENNQLPRKNYSSTWIFGTFIDPVIVNVFEDSFENGTTNWTLVNDLGHGIWTNYVDQYPNNYLLPTTSEGGVLAADADVCGTGGTQVHTTATLNQIFDFSLFTYVWLEFDNDIAIYNSLDKSTIEVSTNAGNSWTAVWSKTGINLRNTNEIIDLSVLCGGKNNIKVRFKSNQPSWGFWWVIDNIKIKGIKCEECTPFRPTNLWSSGAGIGRIRLTWKDNSNNELGFNIERKLGDSLSTNEFIIIDSVDSNSVSYIDTTTSTDDYYTYRVASYNTYGSAGYSNWRSIRGVIPVEFIIFSGSQSLSKIDLIWSTASELNNQGFEIERSTNKTDWIKKGFISGQGTTTEQQNYSFTDDINGINVPKLYYRLKQIDFDGSYEYSEIVEVTVSPMKFSLSQNYPNPFNPSTKISWQSPVGSHQTLKVYDVLGREVATLVNEYRDAGSYEVEFDASKLASGVYYYQLKVGDQPDGKAGFVETKKMMVIK
ncbi:MAG: T9SS type A sorting domain-containing protein [Ignavibacteriales bacterium]|nr:MAG: T9SS type A sorting domain-containing protein [Ignavibacteriales bacterium]